MMGKLGTLQAGRWPGEYRRYGYKAVKIPGERGREIIEDPGTASTVRMIFDMYDSGKRLCEIRAHLIADSVPQIYPSVQKHAWSQALIARTLQSEVYSGCHEGS